MIKEACDLIYETFKHSPVFRVGGDEFVVLLEGEGFQNRERLHKKIHEVVERNSHGEGLVTSIGMKEYKKAEERTFSDLFRDADEPMYRVKATLKANRPEGFSLR